jgi:hypothetical protein
VLLCKGSIVLQKEVVILQFEHSQAVIFPASYAQKLFGNKRHWDEYMFYTPDSALVRRIDKEILDQYCAASKRFNESAWSTTIAYSSSANDKSSLKLAKKQMIESKQRFAEYCKKWKADSKYWGKQYVGYITPKGEKMIYVQLLDFRKDPYHLNESFKLSWIDGWHGWFETNRRMLHYHVDKKLLTVNEDIYLTL